MDKYVNKEGKVINANKKAYNLLYRHRGYRPVEDAKVSDDVDIKPIDDYVKAEISALLNEKGIKHNASDRKDVLYNMLVAGE